MLTMETVRLTLLNMDMNQNKFIMETVAKKHV